MLIGFLAMQQFRTLILRGNRFLGSALVDRRLLSTGDLEKANGTFMDAIQSSDLKRASILSSLLFDLKSLEESALLEYLVDEEKLGLVDLNHIDLESLRPMGIESDLCWATSTVPFDRIDNYFMIATCYYLSQPVVKHWEDLVDGKIIWYATTTASLTRALERIEEIHEAEDAAAENE